MEIPVLWSAQIARENMPTHIKEQEAFVQDINNIQSLIEETVAANRDTIYIPITNLNASAYGAVCGYLRSCGYLLTRDIHNDNDTLIISWRE